MNNNLPLTSSTTVNLKITGVETKFDNQSTLSGRKVKAIVTRVGTAGLKTSNGVDISPNLDNAYLTLVDNKNNKIHEAIPLYLLDPAKNGGSGIMPLSAANIDWTKSSISFADANQATTNKG